MAIQNVVLGTTDTAIFSAPQESAVLSIIFCNTTSESRVITVHAFAAGNTAGDNNTIIKELAIGPKDSFIWSSDEKLILDTAGLISGFADAASAIAVTVNYKGL